MRRAARLPRQALDVACSLVEEGVTTDELDRAVHECHPGAIYLPAGQTYLVESLDLDKRLALVSPTDARYYTIALTAILLAPWLF